VQSLNFELGEGWKRKDRNAILYSYRCSLQWHGGNVQGATNQVSGGCGQPFFAPGA
jgi:hypothetical protein